MTSLIQDFHTFGVRSGLVWFYWYSPWLCQEPITGGERAPLWANQRLPSATSNSSKNKHRLPKCN